MVFRIQRARNRFRHASLWRRQMYKFFNVVASTRPVSVRAWMRDIRQLIYSARRAVLSDDQDLFYEYPADGNIYEYSNPMHEAFQKLLTKLTNYYTRGIRFVPSDVVNEYFQHLEL